MQQCDLDKVRPAAFVQTFFLSKILQSCNPSVKKLFYGTRAWDFHQQWYLIRVKGHPALRTCVPAASDTIIFSCRVKYLTAIILHRVFMCAIPNKKNFFQTCGFTSHVNYLSEQRSNSKADCFWLSSLCGDNQRWVLFTSWIVSVWCRRSAAFVQTGTVLSHVLQMNTLAGAALVFQR